MCVCFVFGHFGWSPPTLGIPPHLIFNSSTLPSSTSLPPTMADPQKHLQSLTEEFQNLQSGAHCLFHRYPSIH